MSQHPLNYASPNRQDERPPYRATPEDRAWLWRRLRYYGLQLLLFLAIVYRIGPNLFLYHSPLSPSAADYVRYTKQYVPIIAAIKAYNRDFGKLPAGDFDLPPDYLPANYHGGGAEILGTSITFETAEFGVIEYDFSPTSEGWIMHFPRYDGRIAAPIVAAAPKPSAQPSVGPATTAPHGK
jgi:hypothetical protein